MSTRSSDVTTSIALKGILKKPRGPKAKKIVSFSNTLCTLEPEKPVTPVRLAALGRQNACSYNGKKWVNKEGAHSAPDMQTPLVQL